MDPKAVIDVTNLAAEQFRRDFLVASVVVLLLTHVPWILGVRWLLRRFTEVQEARVLDQKEAAQRLAIHLDKNTEAVTMLLMDFRSRGKRRRSGELPAVRTNEDG